MKNILKNNLLRLVIIALFSTILFWTSCNYKEIPNDFSFYAQYGIAGTTIVDSYNQQYKQLFADSVGNVCDTTISYVFSDDELRQVYEILIQNKITSYPDKYIPIEHYQVLPDEEYLLRYRINGDEHTIIWDTFTSARDKKSEKLRAIFELIANIVQNNKRVSDLKSKEVYSL